MAGPPGQRLFEHFVVCGLPSSGLVTLNGEQGYVGTDAAYRPCCIDSMPYYESPDKQPPPQLPLVGSLCTCLWPHLHERSS
jgi:hypothetical protein